MDKKGGEVEPVRIFFGQGRRGQFFLRFCADVLYGQPLRVSTEQQIKTFIALLQQFLMHTINLLVL